MRLICAEAKRWPDSPDDVPESEQEEFAAHVESCPYHWELLAEDGEPFTAAARDARSLTPDGSLPLTPEAQAEIEENARRYERWLASGDGALSLSLRFRGEEVALHERFIDFNTRVTRELKGAGDLQLWKLADPASPGSEEVFLGGHLLADFSHDGETLELSLPDGQTVTLAVRHLAGDAYELELACADPEPVSETEGAPEQDDGEAAGARGGAWPMRMPPPQTAGLGGYGCRAFCIVLLVFALSLAGPYRSLGNVGPVAGSNCGTSEEKRGEVKTDWMVIPVLKCVGWQEATDAASPRMQGPVPSSTAEVLVAIQQASAEREEEGGRQLLQVVVRKESGTTAVRVTDARGKTFELPLRRLPQGAAAPAVLREVAASIEATPQRDGGGMGREVPPLKSVPEHAQNEPAGHTGEQGGKADARPDLAETGRPSEDSDL